MSMGLLEQIEPIDILDHVVHVQPSIEIVVLQYHCDGLPVHSAGKLEQPILCNRSMYIQGLFLVKNLNIPGTFLFPLSRKF